MPGPAMLLSIHANPKLHSFLVHPFSTKEGILDIRLSLFRKGFALGYIIYGMIKLLTLSRVFQFVFIDEPNLAG